MNDKLQSFARSEIRKGLELCTEKQRDFFKKMYCLSANLTSDAPIDLIVEKIPAEKLDWAMCQVENTLKKNRLETL